MASELDRAMLDVAHVRAAHIAREMRELTTGNGWLHCALDNGAIVSELVPPLSAEDELFVEDGGPSYQAFLSDLADAGDPIGLVGVGPAAPWVSCDGRSVL